ncbi:hypothetical protein SEA_EVY_150 [Streptomyces phage Evy]|uniref:Uncharacterized protein n=1 Tax=Streptomyces phage Evy TaxID=2588514 RepID=A0A514DK47_9CAUD|nr:hypothetical protein KNU67_gp131 [Streptomyces phage Evy]QDH94001.1 hypothetical protein SEA_EVY_150 [Streptomyces phage Evy]UEM46922.1 hypothetical protein SEA_TARGARYEN_155 [Streptomyces phage Targaryen]
MAVEIGDSEETKAESEVEQDGRPIKEIIKDSAKNYARAKGRQAFFWAVKNMKAQGKAKGKSARSVKVPTKKASALRIGDLTAKGELKNSQTSPIDKKKMELTFIGDSGVVFETVDKNQTYKVVSRRDIKES